MPGMATLFVQMERPGLKLLRVGVGMLPSALLQGAPERDAA